MIVFLASILSGVFIGLNEIIYKNISEKKYSAFSYAFLQWSLNLIVYGIPFIIYGSFPGEAVAYFYLLALSACYIIGNVFIIKAYKTEDISILNILSKSSLIIAFVSGILLLNEKLTVYKIAGVLSIMIGIIIIFYEGKKLKPSPGYVYALFSGIAYGLTAYFDKKALLFFNLISLLFIFNLIATLVLLFIPKAFTDAKQVLKKYKGKIILSRLFMAGSSVLFLWSLQKGSVSVVNTNTESAFLLSTLIVGIMFLREKSHIPKKIFGSLFCIAGIILLNFF